MKISPLSTNVQLKCGSSVLITYEVSNKYWPNVGSIKSRSRVSPVLRLRVSPVPRVLIDSWLWMPLVRMITVFTECGSTLKWRRNKEETKHTQCLTWCVMSGRAVAGSFLFFLIIVLCLSQFNNSKLFPFYDKKIFIKNWSPSLKLAGTPYGIEELSFGTLSTKLPKFHSFKNTIRKLHTGLDVFSFNKEAVIFTKKSQDFIHFWLMYIAYYNFTLKSYFNLISYF